MFRFRTVGLVTALITALLVGPVTAAQGVAMPTAKKAVFSFSTTLDAGYKDEVQVGRFTYGVTILTGETTIKGQKVALERVSVYQYEDSSGPISGFLTMTWPDGSTVSLSVSGQTEQTASGARIFATLRAFAATGAWKGYGGMGLMQGVRKGPIGTPVVYDFAIELTKD